MLTEYPRDLIRITVRDENGDSVSDAYWSDVGTRSVQVTDPNTGSPVTYTFRGAGSLIEMSPIPSVAGLTVQSVTLRLSQINERVADLLRGYDATRAPVTIWRGYLDPTSREFTGSAGVRFNGFLDHFEIVTPEAGGVGYISAEVSSDTSELARSNSSTRSHADQKLRDPDDNFFKDVATAPNWEINWGGEKKRIDRLNAFKERYGR